MCYRRQTQTKVAVIICCILSGIAVCSEISKAITLLFAMLGLSVYFLVTSVKLFQEMSGVTSGWSKGIVLQPISSQPIARSTEVGNYHLHSGDQNQTYGYQEQPPAYQSKGSVKRNKGNKSDYSSNQV